MSVLPKVIYRFYEMPIKIPTTFLIIIEKNKNSQGSPRVPKANLSKKSNVGSIKISDFKLYYKDRVTKTAWYW
jgi:hypothetical protein